MLTLLSYAQVGGLCPSPFGAKAEALLRMSGLPHAVKPGNPTKAPRGKLPVLIDGATTIPDSSHIQAWLETRHGIDFDGPLSARQKAVAEAFRRMAEEHLYFAIVHARWIGNPAATREAFFGAVPSAIRPLVYAVVVRKVARALQGQGIGLHTAEQILEFGRRDLDAIAEAVEGPFFFGARPTSLDASLYGVVAGTASVPIDTPLRDHIRSEPRLMAYVEAMGAHLASLPDPVRRS